MADALTWAALIGSIGSICTFVTFWIKIGREIGEAKKGAEDAKLTAIAANAKASLVSDSLADFKVAAIKDFASLQELQGLEARLANQLEILGKRMDRMVDRIDRFLDRQSDRPRQDQ